MASFSVGILVGPAVGSMLSALTATWVACSCGLLTVAYVYFLVPESLSQAAMLEVRTPVSARRGHILRSSDTWLANVLRLEPACTLLQWDALCEMRSQVP